MEGVFILKFNKKSEDYEDFKTFMKLYHQNDIQECLKRKTRSPIFIDYSEIKQYFDSLNKDFWKDINFRQLFKKYERGLNEDRENIESISLFLKEVPENVELQNLDADWNGKFISTTAMIKTIADTSPQPTIAVYTCKNCGANHTMIIEGADNLKMPTRCQECGSKSLDFNSDLSEYKNYAYLKLEVPLELRVNGKNKSFKGYMEDYLATSHHDIKAGDVCNVCGWFRVKPSQKRDSNLEFIIEIHNILPVDKDFEESYITEEDKEKILELSKQEDIFSKFVHSLAPEMYGYEDVKKGLILQLFEGLRPSENTNKKVNVEDRWTIHILLIGDPGIGKSKLSNGVNNKAPKSIITNGAGATKVGLLSAVIKDDLTNSYVTEAGAIVLADSGVLIIDEFDKLLSEAQTGLNEPMEQLMVSSAKAGVVQTLTARTSVLAIANPKYSRFNEMESMKKQLDIVESTLSRFDLVFAIRDVINVERDRKLAHNILFEKYKSFMNDNDLIDDILFKKYINYAKSNVFPELDDEAKKYLEDVYVNVRKEAFENTDSKPITMRDLMSIKRLTIARAKVELRDVATVKDAEESVSIYTKSLESIGLDLTTVGEKQSVMSPRELQIIKDAENSIKELFDLYGQHIDKEDLDDVLDNIKVDCASIKTKMNADDVFHEAYNNVKREYNG